RQGRELRELCRTGKFRGQDLNLRPPGYEPGELPLLHPGIDPLLPSPLGERGEESGYLALALPPLWPRKRRVGLNSPSLWPIMSSVTNTFRNALPLCTRNVCPMKSGTMVQSRDHVLSGSRCPRPMRSTLASRRSSTWG